MRWCSILVSSTYSQDGPKNPLKGTSMKFLVLASNAQFGIDAEVKVMGRPAMACRPRSPFPWRPTLVAASWALIISYQSGYGLGLNLHIGASCAGCRVACLEWNKRDNGQTFSILANMQTLLLFETCFAKEDKNRCDCRGKLLGCLFYWHLRDWNADSVAVRSYMR